MSTIAQLRADHYRIALPVTLSDSMHGAMTHFELVTVRIRDADGAQGIGYTYTVGCNGSAIHATIERDLAPRLHGEQADLIEALWQKMWWAIHYGGRGRARRARLPGLRRLLARGADDPGRRRRPRPRRA